MTRTVNVAYGQICIHTSQEVSDDNQPRWVHDCPVCGATLTGEQGEHCAEHGPSADELARKQRVVDAIGTYMAKPPKPPRRWRR